MSKNKPTKVLVWLDRGPYVYIHLGVASSLSKLAKFDFFGIVGAQQDVSFFNNQKIVPFREIIYYPDCYLKKSSFDINYLKESEKKFDLNLWLDVYGERFFHKHRTYFHTFSKSEILIIVENTIKFFSELLKRINPELIIMQTAGENIANTLLFKIAKNLKIQVLMMNLTHIHNRIIVSNNLTNQEISEDFKKTILNFDQELQDFGPDFIKEQSLAETVKVQHTLPNNNAVSIQKLSHYINRLYNDPEPIYQNIGKTKSKMIKSKFSINIETKKRKAFLDKNSITQIEDDDFLYFPLQTEPDATVLVRSPFFSSQLAVIENVARSIPVNFILYVKEHPGQVLKLWRSIDFYKTIIELPNVKLVHPTVNSQDLISRSSGIISIIGSTGFEALFYKKPIILFADEYYDCLSMVNKVNNLTELPHLISETISSFEFNNKELNVLIKSANNQSITIPYSQMIIDAVDISSLQRTKNNSELTEKKFKNFYENYKESFELIGNEFKKRFFNIK